MRSESEVEAMEAASALVDVLSPARKIPHARDRAASPGIDALVNAMISEEVPPRIRMKASRRAAMSAAGARSGKSRSDTMEAAEMLVGAPF